MELRDIVMKLVGPVQPVGDSNIDQQRLANMRDLTDLVDSLLGEISTAANAADSSEASRKAIGVHARDFMFEVTNQ